MNLATIPDMKKRFKLDVGLSDHSLTNDASIAAVALGACVIEKHITLKRSDGGPDASFSLEPKEFASLVSSIRIAQYAIGKPNYDPSDNEKENKTFRKSLIVTKDIQKGEKFTKDNVRSLRPGHGLAPKSYRQVLKKRASKDIARATPLSQSHIA